MKKILFILGAVLAVDFLGFIAWIFSGQFPVDGFYFGVITSSVIKLFI
jgi:hypothetical protein